MRGRTIRAPAKIKAREFKAKCFELMDTVAATGASIVITKRGTPIARLVPAVDPPSSVFGFAKGSFEEIGEIISPATTEWRPDQDELNLLEGGAARLRRPARRARSHTR